MANTKHVGRLINTDRRVVVVFREVPDEPNSCLVVDTDALVDWMHDGLINAVESPGAQQSANFYEYASRQTFSDGTNMLNTLHFKGLLRKADTSNVMMTPNTQATIRLDELNALIREQTGEPAVAPEADAVQADAPAEASTPDVLDDAALAAQLREQAALLEQQAKELHAQADELAPKKRTRKKATA